MIGKHKNFKFAALQVVAPGLKSFNYSQQFLIVRFVPSLYQDYFPREKSYWVPLVGLRSELVKNTTYSITGNIGFDLNVALWIKMMEDKGFCKGLPQPQKG